MDGNGRYAKARGLPRVAGHKAGLDVARNIARVAAERGIEVLSLFAFSSENWGRPRQEVKFLMDLFAHALKNEASDLAANDIRVRFVGEKSALPKPLQEAIVHIESDTMNNTRMQLLIMINYGGRWDISQAMRAIAQKVASGELKTDVIDESIISQHLAIGDVPDPDLIIRTSGVERLSNFYLWQSAYSEFYFSPVNWPEFTTEVFDEALSAYQKRQRRFGCIPDAETSSSCC